MRGTPSGCRCPELERLVLRGGVEEPGAPKPQNPIQINILMKAISATNIVIFLVSLILLLGLLYVTYRVF